MTDSLFVTIEFVAWSFSLIKSGDGSLARDARIPLIWILSVRQIVPPAWFNIMPAKNVVTWGILLYLSFDCTLQRGRCGHVRWCRHRSEWSTTGRPVYRDVVSTSQYNNLISVALLSSYEVAIPFNCCFLQNELQIVFWRRFYACLSILLNCPFQPDSAKILHQDS